MILRHDGLGYRFESPTTIQSNPLQSGSSKTSFHLILVFSHFAISLRFKDREFDCKIPRKVPKAKRQLNSHFNLGAAVCTRRDEARGFKSLSFSIRSKSFSPVLEDKVLCSKLPNCR